MQLKNWLGIYETFAARMNWVRRARRFVNRKARQGAPGYVTPGGASNFGPSRWHSSKRMRRAMQRQDYYAARMRSTERLEDRTLLSATVQVSLGDLVVTGDETNDRIQVTLSGDGSSYQIQDLDGDAITAIGGGFSGGGTPSVTIAKAGINGIEFDLKGGDDQATHTTGATPDTLPQGFTVIDDTGTDSARLLGLFSTSGADIAVSAESVTLDKGQNVAAGNISLTTDAISIGQPLTGSGTLTIKPLTVSTTIGIGAAAPAGTLDLSDTELTRLTDGWGSIVIGDMASGTGTVTVDSSAFEDDVTIYGGDINVTGAFTNLANENISLQSGGTLDIGANVTAIGTGAIDLDAALNILIDSSAVVSTVDGNTDLNAHPGGMAGSLNAITIDGATVQATGTGAVTIEGTGGTTSGIGVFVRASSNVSTQGGILTVDGTSIAGGLGIFLDGSTVTSTTGTIDIDGAAGGTGSRRGVLIAGTASVTSTSGDIDLNGTVSATGSLGAGVFAEVSSANVITIQTGGTGSVTITGTATAGDNYGIHIGDNRGTMTVAATGSGNLIFNATGTGTSPAFHAQTHDTGVTTIGNAAATGALTINADSVTLVRAAGTGTLNVLGTGPLSFVPLTASTSIGLGGGAGDLNLDDDELALLQDGFSSITIGDAAAGTGAVDVDSSTFNDPVTIVGGSIAVTELNADAGRGRTAVRLRQQRPADRNRLHVRVTATGLRHHQRLRLDRRQRRP